MRRSSAPRPKAVVDTNLFVSGMIFERGTPYALLEAWRTQRFVLLVSDQQHAELTDVFGRPRIVARYGLTARALADLFAGLATAPRVEPSPTLPVEVRDTKDEKILAAALGGEAGYVVTGDKDLTALAGDPRLGEMKIVTAAEFLAILDAFEEQEAEEEAEVGEDEGLCP